MQPTNPEDPNATTHETSTETLHDLVTPESSPTTPPVSEGTSNLELRDGETTKDALQREIVSIIKGASDYAERHQRDDGTLGLKQIELVVPGPKESHEVINIGYFGNNPEASQLIIKARPLGMNEIPYPTDVKREHIFGGFPPSGQEVIDYILQQGQEEVSMETNKYKALGHSLTARDLYEKRTGVATEEDLTGLRGKIANSTIEGKRGTPDLKISTLLQGSPVSPTPNTGV